MNSDDADDSDGALELASILFCLVPVWSVDLGLV